MRRLLIFLVLVLWAPAACDRSTGLQGMTEEEFVQTMAELRRIEQDITMDSAARTTARRNTLQERDLTPEQLEAAARSLAEADPDHALALWQRIDSLATAGSIEEPDTTR